MMLKLVCLGFLTFWAIACWLNAKWLRRTQFQIISWLKAGYSKREINGFLKDKYEPIQVSLRDYGVTFEHLPDGETLVRFSPEWDIRDLKKWGVKVNARREIILDGLVEEE